MGVQNKNTLRFMGIMLLAMMVAIAWVPMAFAATQGTVTINATQESHSYDAYRLVACDVSGTNAISNPSIDGCMTPEFFSAVTDETDPNTIVDWLAAEADTDEAPALAVNLAHEALAYAPDAAEMSIATGETVTLPSGVYLFVSNDAQPIIAAVGGDDLTISEKSTVPDVQKHVKESDEADDWGKSTTAGATRELAYQLEGSLPNNYSAFTQYYFAFLDQHDPELVVNLDSITVSVHHDDGEVQLVTQGYEIVDEAGLLTITFHDLKQAIPNMHYGDRLLVEYSVKLASTASSGSSNALSNTVQAEYTRTPMSEALGKTPLENTSVYTYSLRITKRDGKNDIALAGAKFALRLATGGYVTESGDVVDGPAQAARTTDENGQISFNALATGDYSLVEVEAPVGYEKVVVDIPVTIAAAGRDYASLTAEVRSKSATITNVDTSNGTIDVEVVNEPLDGYTPPANPPTSTDTPKSGNPGTTTSTSSKVPDGYVQTPLGLAKTSDLMISALILIAAAAVSAGLVLTAGKRKGGRGKGEGR